MEYSLNRTGKNDVEITFTLNAEEWDKEVKEAYNKNKFKYSLEGFRKGKVPMNILVKRYGIEFFYEEAMDDCLNKNYGEILEKEKLEVVSKPEVDIKKVDKDGLEVLIKVTVQPEIEVGQYKGLTFTKAPVEATEEEIKADMDKEVEKRARLITKDGAAENGDTVVIDYSGSVDGVKFEGGTAENHSLALGSGSFIPGFEEQLVGIKAGESKDITVTFPEQYAEQLAGKEAVFAITCHEVQVKELPTLDDEFVKDIDDELNTVAEWKEKIAKKISDRKKQDSEYKLENDIIDAVINNTEMDIPDCMVEDEIDYRIQELQNNITQRGLKFEDYLKYTGMTTEQLRTEERESCLHNIKARLVIEAITKKEELTIQPEELQAKLADLPKEGISSEYVNYMANQLLVDKFFAFLKENNEIVEGTAEKAPEAAPKKAKKAKKTEEPAEETAQKEQSGEEVPAEEKPAKKTKKAAKKDAE